MTSTINYGDVVPALVAQLPEFAPLLEEHLHDNFGELLPHVFFGAVTRHVLERTAASVDKSEDWLKKVTAFMCQVFEHGDEGAQNLVAVSFVENLDPPSPGAARVTAMLSPHLMTIWRAFYG